MVIEFWQKTASREGIFLRAGDNVMFNCWYGLDGQCTSPCQIACWWVKPLRRAKIWPFVDFSRWRPSAVLKFLKFWILTAHMALGWIYLTVLNFMPIGQTVAVCHYGFSKIEIISEDWVQSVNYGSPCLISWRSNVTNRQTDSRPRYSICSNRHVI